jgi:hypothetical protein
MFGINIQDTKDDRLSQKKVSELISLNTYKKCKQFTLFELLNELKLRNWLAKTNYSDLVFHPQIGNLIRIKDHFKQFWFNKIISGQPFANAYDENFLNAHLPFVKTIKKKQILNLSDSPALSIFTDRDILESANTINKNIQIYEEMDVSKELKCSYKDWHLDTPHRTSRSHLTVVVDLSYPNPSLKKAFENALSSWRSELRLQKNTAQSWRVTKLSNLIAHNVFFIQDYLFLCSFLKQKKSLDTLCTMIKGDDLDYENFVEVDYKFAIKTLDSGNIALLEQKIESRPELKTRPFKDAIHDWK